MIQKQNVHLDFSQGLDTKTDPNQVAFGKFESLENSVFSTLKRLTKRPGYSPLASVPDSSALFLTTFNGDLTSIGSSLQAYSPGSQSWVNKGVFQPIDVSTAPLVRNTLNQTQCDVAVSGSFVLTGYSEFNGSTTVHKYAVSDLSSGQNIVAPTTISGASATYGAPRVFVLGGYFVIVYSSNAGNLDFITLSTVNPTGGASAPVTIATNYTPHATGAFDGTVFQGSLYVAWNGTTGGMQMASITQALFVTTVTVDAAHNATIVSVSSTTDGYVWVSYYDSGTSNGYSRPFLPTYMTPVSAATNSIPSVANVVNLASTGGAGSLFLFYETSQTLTGVPANYVSLAIVALAGGVSSTRVSIRSLGLASKAFMVNGVIYYWAIYSSSYQPTYFLVNGSTSSEFNPAVIARLAYQNGGSYLGTGLPSVTVSGTTTYFPYLFKDLVQALAPGNAARTQATPSVYSQTGINLATVDFAPAHILSSEIGSNLNLTGGFLWGYDGFSLTEQGFHLFPEGIPAPTPSNLGGTIPAGTHFYAVTYEWGDNQGNLFRSAPSIPVPVTTTGTTSSVPIVIPTLRVTAKLANPVKICVYRYSDSLQTYYQIGNNGANPITSPVFNDPSIDTITFTDTSANVDIQGNNILYTTGGVIEDIGGPACSAMTLFDDRLWLVDAEDRNLLWFSKQVIESTPVEMSDLLTFYVAPSIGATGPTGPIQALSALDDKLIIFKRNAIYYLYGSGPDNTGANNGYSQPALINSTVGCDNPDSIVYIPSGLMFQSEKGIWLLGRDLSTKYIGDAVEAFNGYTVTSAKQVPGTNYVIFTLNTSVSLMYDYYMEQWGTFTGLQAQSATLFDGLHTYMTPARRVTPASNPAGYTVAPQVMQSTPGKYLDGSRPVLMSFTTSWLNLAGIQGYQRAFFFFILAGYKSPHRMLWNIGYNYNPPSQQVSITPSNSPSTWGSDSMWGGSTPWGGTPADEKWRVFFDTQRCEAFQLSFQEQFDPSYGTVAGEGLTMSGLNLVYGIKKGYRPQSSSNSAG